jgi:hypothetical protein
MLNIPKRICFVRNDSEYFIEIRMIIGIINIPKPVNKGLVENKLPTIFFS